MIRISCTNCKTVLSIDDAFAGGVCRCQHCGTIQTVPAHARDTAEVGAAGQSMGGSKSLYQHGSDARSGTGLDELAGIVVSSGLSSSRLTRPAGNGPVTRQNLMPLIVAGGIVMAILILIIIFLVTRGASSSPAGGGNGTAGQPIANGTPAQVAGTPNFGGTKLDGNTIIYLLDCGDATGQYLGELKDATIKSALSLGSDRKFEIMFWNNGTDGAYPENTTTYASKESVDAAQKAVDDVFAAGQTDIKAALKKAIDQHPDQIVIATGKGWDLDNAWLDSVMAIRGSSPVKMITYNLVSDDSISAPLQRLAERTGGSYHAVTKAQLHDFGQ